MKTAPETFTRPVPPPPPDPFAEAVTAAQANVEAAQRAADAAAEDLRLEKLRRDDAHSRHVAEERRRQEEADRLGLEAYAKPRRDRAEKLDAGILEALAYLSSALAERDTLDRELRARFKLAPGASALRQHPRSGGSGDLHERFEVAY